MKHLLKVFALAAIVAFVSCDKDDDSASDVTKNEDTTNTGVTEGDVDKTPGKLLVGTWVLSELEYESTSVATQEGITVTTKSWGEAFDMNYLITFNDDNTLLGEGEYTIRLKTIAEFPDAYDDLGFGEMFQDTLVNKVTMTDIAEPGNWLYDNGVYYLLDSEDNQKIAIEVMDDNTLKVPYLTSENEKQEGADVNMLVSGTVLLVRK